jgi:eukaryotic-like serine/threonine-protein kinase
MIPTTPQDLVDELWRVQLLSAAQFEVALAEAARCTDAASSAARLVALNILTRFQADQILQGYAHELVLGPYRLMAEIGEGGMGHVFKAWQPRLNRVVAVKMIRPDLLAYQPDALARFHREAQAIAQLNSPHVVTLYDAGEVNGLHFLAMEYVDGIDLGQMVRLEGPLPFAVACDYVRQAAIGLEHAHEAGLVHRDVKPSNLLVTRSGPARGSGIWRQLPPEADTPPPNPAHRVPVGPGLVKLLDMGLARLVGGPDEAQAAVTLTQQGTLIGTPDFIAPEQARDPSRVDIRADLYSLGCTFYFLLTGRPPFPDGTPVEKLLKHQTEHPRRVEYLRARTPEPVLTVLYRLMQKRPDDRYQTPREVADALARVQVALQADPAGGGSSGRIDLDVTRLAVASAVRDVVLPRGAGPYALTANVAVPARRTHLLDKTHLGYVTGLGFSADGRWLVTGGLDGTLRVWDLRGDRPADGPSVTGRLGEVQIVAVSPAETCVFTGSSSARGQIWRWDWTEPQPRRGLCRVPGEPAGQDALAVSSDGTLLAASSGPDVCLWAVSGRAVRRSGTIKGQGGVAKALAFAPDGRRLATAGGEGTVFLWEFGWFRTIRKAALSGHTDAVASVAFAPNGLLMASGSHDRTIRLWDASGEDCLPRAVLHGHSGPVRLVQFLPPGMRLMSVGDGGEAILWDVITQSKVRAWTFDQTLAAGIALSADGRTLAVGAGEGQVHLFDLEQPTLGHTAPVATVF